MTDKFHLFGDGVGVELPERFNNPFSYRPHPLCERAAEEVRAVVRNNSEWNGEASQGKMFGVLVVKNSCGRCGYLAAFSGLLCGSNEHDFFVPAVFDFLSPDGYFKCEEREISYINNKVYLLLADKGYCRALEELKAAEKERSASLEAERKAMQDAKIRREERRHFGGLSSDDEERMLNESRFAKAEYKRNVKRWDEKLLSYKEAAAFYDNQIAALKAARKRRSAALQQWLFDNFVFYNSFGECSSLSQIFSGTAQGVPPAGAGECAAPKLLQYAFKNGYAPMAMAEFWMGASPVGEVRRDGCFYGSCISKCKPILGFMLKGMDVEPMMCSAGVDGKSIGILYEDGFLMAVDKPSGMLSVPGVEGGVSVEEYLQGKYGNGSLRVVHRLDMPTSGVLLVAKSAEMFVALQRLFAGRKVQKRYVALLDGVPEILKGEISLPLSADYDNRPRQMVDYDNGKQAVTLYEVTDVVEYGGRSCAKVRFYPLTGRTHQLRMHAAHPAGLGIPIVGDELYGEPGKRLMLHAESVSFIHPVTGKMVNILSDIVKY